MATRSEKSQLTITGHGPRTILLGHGFGSDQTVWQSMRAALNPHYRVISYNLAGAGPQGEASFEPQRHTTLYAYADDLLQILEEQDVRSAVYIGHSVSCMLGAIAAVTRPESFERMILMQASPRYINTVDYFGGFEQGDLDAIYAAMATNFQNWAAGFVPMVMGVDDSHVLAKYTQTLFQMRPDIALSVLRMIFQSDMREVVQRINTPTYLLHSREDVAVPQQVADWLHRHVAHSHLDVMDVAGHLPIITEPDAVWRAVQQCLEAPVATA